ncbi:MAG: hypothetical protein HY901_34800 [Deltaproteobacteria bacterium]|nr:hypothetical protein [Deltaproteobacteria bacterium]
MPGSGDPADSDVFYVKDGVARLGYEVHPASLSPLENWYALVDAETGELRWRVNRVYRDDAGVESLDAAAEATDAGEASSDAGTGCAYDAGPEHSDKAMVWMSNPGADSTRPLTEVTLPHLRDARNPEGHLVGELLDAYSCCPNLGCVPGAPSKTVTGTVTFGTFSLPFSTVFCDFQPRASNNGGCRTSYDYSGEEPLRIDPPDPQSVPGSGDPADSDVFAEVHVYFHANRAYDYIREVGDPGFLLRDSDPAKSPNPVNSQLWANFATPDINNAQVSFSGVAVNQFMRVDNSAFLPREEWAKLPFTVTNPLDLPQTDAFAIFQGENADFAYDGEVVYHEFIHGVVYSTAQFSGPHLDQYGAMDEGGTLHEALADFYAAAITNDPVTAEWVGARLPAAPNGEGAARDLTSDHKCPDHIIGEVHYDSLPFSSATWSLRQRHLDADQGKSFDGAVFDALASLTSTSGFEEMAAAVADALQTAFGVDAKADALAEYAARGVTDCVKVLDYQQPRAQLYLAGTDNGYQPYAPAPLQFKLAAPQGASAVIISAKYSQAAHIDLMGQPSQPHLQALVSLNKHITFTGPADAISDDSAISQPFAVDAAAGTVTAEVPVDARPGDVVHVALVSLFNAQEPLADVTLSLAAMLPPDAGAPLPGPDAASEAGPDAAAIAGPDATLASAIDAGTGSTSDDGDGCGCASASAAPLAVAGLFAVLALRRRRR